MEQLKVLAGGIIIFLLTSSVVYSQSWEKKQPNKLYATDKSL